MVRISNLNLVLELRKNSRIPFVKIAKRFGVSETAVRKRVGKLEEEGVIRGYTIDVDPRKIGFQIRSFIGIDTKPENYTSVLERLKGVKGILSMYTTSGDHMICMECWFEDSKKLSEFVKVLRSIEGVSRICPMIIMEKIK